MSFSSWILVGVAIGLFLGDHAAPFRILADGFSRLLQMTVHVKEVLLPARLAPAAG